MHVGLQLPYPCLLKTSLFLDQDALFDDYAANLCLRYVQYSASKHARLTDLHKHALSSTQRRGRTPGQYHSAALVQSPQLALNCYLRRPSCRARCGRQQDGPSTTVAMGVLDRCGARYVAELLLHIRRVEIIQARPHALARALLILTPAWSTSCRTSKGPTIGPLRVCMSAQSQRWTLLSMLQLASLMWLH